MADIVDTAIEATSAIPEVGTAISTGLGIGKGIFDLIKSNREKKKAQGLRPPMEDPEMRQYLGYLQRKKRAIETGSVYGRQAAEIGSEMANTQSGVVQASGGNAGAAILGLTQAQRGAGRAYGDLVDRSQPLIAQYEGDIGKTLQDMSDRRLNLQNRDYEQALGEAATLQKSGEEAIMGGVARAIPMVLPKRKLALPAPAANATTSGANTGTTDLTGMPQKPSLEEFINTDVDPFNAPDYNPNELIRRSSIPMANY